MTFVEQVEARVKRLEEKVEATTPKQRAVVIAVVTAAVTLVASLVHDIIRHWVIG